MLIFLLLSQPPGSIGLSRDAIRFGGVYLADYTISAEPRYRPIKPRHSSDNCSPLPNPTVEGAFDRTQRIKVLLLCSPFFVLRRRILRKRVTRTLTSLDRSYARPIDSPDLAALLTDMVPLICFKLLITARDWWKRTRSASTVDTQNFLSSGSPASLLFTIRQHQGSQRLKVKCSGYKNASHPADDPTQLLTTKE